MNRGSWIGQTLGGRYRIDEILGQGGMSAVYKAYDPNLKRVVAIKLIHPHLSNDPRFITRFEEEATAVAQLRHPNIVQVYDFNHDGDLYYMVQELIPGETLQDRLRRLNKSGRRMPLADAIRYTVNISEATGYAHKRGMIHRDIKPANIMLDVQDQAILMDFGIVKILGGEKHTATGAVVGTALYLPPEVIRGETPDARSDLYSLGVTLYEMVSGKPPFEADSAMTLMMMHLNDPLPDLRSLRPEVPAGLIEVIEKALAKTPGQRYPSMNEFATALKACSLEGSAPIYQATQVGEDLPPEAGRPAIQAAAATIAVTGGIEPARSPESEPVKPVTSTDRTLQDNKTGLATDGINDSQSLAENPPSRKIPWALIGGAAVILLIAVFGIVWITNGRGANAKLPEVTPTSQAGVALLSESTPTPTATTPVETLSPTDTPTITPTPEPTLKPSPTITPTPTIPAGVPYVVIRGISVDDRGRYIVEYETFEYTEELPGQHIHFFFNTVPPEQAGNPGKGPWKLYGGPRPFDGYRQADRPPAATQMCALVANPNHSVQPESGTCFILPDVNVTAPYEDSACLAGPDPAFPSLSQLESGQVLLINGLSPDEAWWNVFQPENPAGNALFPQETCWIERSQSSFQGDMSTMAMVEAPLPPPGEPEKMVTITNITLDEQGNYVVEYQVQGFEEKLPGTHLHFFFDIFSADQVGQTGGGNRLMYAGPSPFTGFNQANRPADATALCALVANPDHTVIEGSGNCTQLP